MNNTTNELERLSAADLLAVALGHIQCIHENFHRAGKCRDWWDRAHYRPVDMSSKDKIRFFRSADKCGVPTVAAVLGISRLQASIQMEQAMKHNGMRTCGSANAESSNRAR